MFNNVNRYKHSSQMKNTVTNENKHSLQLFALVPQIPLKLKWHPFFHNQPQAPN